MTKSDPGYHPRKIKSKLELFDWMLSLFTTRSEPEYYVHHYLSNFEGILKKEMHENGLLRPTALEAYDILFDCFVGQTADVVLMSGELTRLAYSLCIWAAAADQNSEMNASDIIELMSDIHSDLPGVVYEKNGRVRAKLPKNDPRKLGAYFNISL